MIKNARDYNIIVIYNPVKFDYSIRFSLCCIVPHRIYKYLLSICAHALQTYVKDHHYLKPLICRLTRKQALHYSKTTERVSSRRRRTHKCRRRREQESERRTVRGHMTKRVGWERREWVDRNKGRRRERKGSSCQALSGVKHHHKYNLIRSESVRAHTYTYAQDWPVFKISVSAVSKAVTHICPRSLQSRTVLWCIMLNSCGGVFLRWPHTSWYLKPFQLQPHFQV